MATAARPPSEPLVSIVTPLLNQADFLEETLDSVASQDYPSLEHIVVDGGSTDGSLKILEGFAGSLEVVSAPGLSQVEAINEGFARARGTLLAWLNGDDVYLAGAVGRAVRFFAERPEARLVYGDAIGIDEHGREYGRRVNVRAGDLRVLVEEGDFVVQPAAFWRSDLWSEVGGLRADLGYALDYELWMRMAAATELHYLPVALAKERIHPGAKTFVGGIERVEELRRVAELHGGVGIPRDFRPEASAAYFLRSLGRLLQGRWRGARLDTIEAVSLCNRPLKAAAFCAAALLPGRDWIPRARLWSNRIRARSESAASPDEVGSA